MVVLRRAMLGAGTHRDPVLSILSGGRPPGSAAHLRQAHYLISRTGCSHPTPTLSTIAARPGTSSSSGPGRSCPSAYASGPMGSDQWKLVLVRTKLRRTAAQATRAPPSLVCDVRSFGQGWLDREAYLGP